MDLATLRETAELTRDDIREAAAKYFGEEWFVVIAGGVNEELEPLQ